MAVVLLSLLLRAADDGDPLPRDLRWEVAQAETESFRLGLTLGAQGRASLPFGAADRGTIIATGFNTITIVNHLDYSELFNPGWGFTLEADVMLRPSNQPPGALPSQQSPTLGGYAAFGWDWYGGSHTQDNAGTEVRPDTLRTSTIFVGIKGTGVVEGDFFGDLRFGLGAVHYDTLDATFRPRTGPEGRGELFADTWAFALEVRMHFGWHVGAVGVVFGLGGRLQAPPDRGADSSLDPDAFYALDFDVGLELSF